MIRITEYVGNLKQDYFLTRDTEDYLTRSGKISRGVSKRKNLLDRKNTFFFFSICPIYRVRGHKHVHQSRPRGWRLTMEGVWRGDALLSIESASVKLVFVGVGGGRRFISLQKFPPSPFYFHLFQPPPSLTHSHI